MVDTWKNAREWYKLLRTVNGLTNAQVAFDVGVTDSTLYYFETGRRNISLDLANRVAKYFGVSLTQMRLKPAKTTILEILKEKE